MSNIQDNTIFSPSVFSPGLLGRTGAFQTYLLDKRNGTGVLDQNPGASAAYSLYDLGNRRGTVVETEATYHNPAVRLRRDSDGTHKSFPAGAFTQMQNWANEDVETYASDFSVDADGNTAKSGTVTGNVDSIGGEDDNLSFWADGSNTTHGIVLPQSYFVSGNQYLLSVDVYIPSGNTNVDKAGVYFSGSSTVPASITTTDAWVTLTYQFTYGSGSDTGAVRITQLVDVNNPEYIFTGANSASDDLIYIRNVSITQLTSNAYATTWYDQSGSDNDATQTTADNQPKVVDAGVLVTDANGNYSLDFDGVDDHLDVATIAGAQPATLFATIDLDIATSFELIDGVAADTNRILIDVSGGVYRMFAGSSLNGPTTTADPALLYFLADGASSEIGLDGAAASTGDAGTNSAWPNGATIGTSLGGTFTDGKLSSVTIYPTDQSANRSAIEQSISNTLTTALS